MVTRRRFMVGVGATLGWVAVAGRSLTARAQDATPEAMTDPVGIRWQLVAIESADGTSVMPDDPSRYTLELLPGGEVLIQADCNSGGGDFTIEGSSLTFGPMRSTLMMCPEGTIDAQYTLALDSVQGFAVTGNELMLTTKEGGQVRFSPALGGVVWQWQETAPASGDAVVPDDPARYTLEFLPATEAVILADCNRGIGTYAVDGDAIKLGPFATTRMYCGDGSLDSDYLIALDSAASYSVSGGALLLTLSDGGVMTFAASSEMPAPEASPVSGG